jgi:hypothetical protein
MKSEGHPFERRAAARVRVAIQPRLGRRALGVDCAGSDLALDDSALCVVGNDVTGMVLIKYDR